MAINEMYRGGNVSVDPGAQSFVELRGRYEERHEQAP
jgi:hypothetical protein